MMVYVLKILFGKVREITNEQEAALCEYIVNMETRLMGLHQPTLGVLPSILQPS